MFVSGCNRAVDCWLIQTHCAVDPGRLGGKTAVREYNKGTLTAFLFSRSGHETRRSQKKEGKEQTERERRGQGCVNMFMSQGCSKIWNGTWP